MERVELTVVVTVPQNLEEIVEVPQSTLQDPVQNLSAEQKVDVSMPQIVMERIVGVSMPQGVEAIPQEQILFRPK